MSTPSGAAYPGGVPSTQPTPSGPQGGSTSPNDPAPPPAGSDGREGQDAPGSYPVGQPRTTLGDMQAGPGRMVFASYNANGLTEPQWDLLCNEMERLGVVACAIQETKLRIPEVSWDQDKYVLWADACYDGPQWHGRRRWPGLGHQGFRCAVR